MTSPGSAVPRAHRAALLAFATNGALVGSLLPRYPEIARALDLSTAGLGLTVVAFAVGAAAAGRLPEVPLRRFGSRRVVAVGTWGIALALWLAALAAGLGPAAAWGFAALLAVAGFGDAVVDVAQNAQGLRVQRALGRSALGRMHAGWSAGAAGAGLLGTVAASAGVPLGVHLAATGVAFGTLATAAARDFLAEGEATGPSGTRSPSPTAGPASDPAGASSARPAPLEIVPASPTNAVALAALATVALGGLAVEVIGADWAAWFLSTVHGVPAERAGVGVAAVLGAQFAGRLVGDRVIDRLGGRGASRTGLCAVVAGLLLAAWSPSTGPALAGLALAGAGSAVTVPVAFAGADALPGLPPGRGLAVIGWAMRAVTLGVSPTVGLAGEAFGLSVALSIVAVVAGVAAVATAATPGAPATGVPASTDRSG